MLLHYITEYRLQIICKSKFTLKNIQTLDSVLHAILHKTYASLKLAFFSSSFVSTCYASWCNLYKLLLTTQLESGDWKKNHNLAPKLVYTDWRQSIVATLVARVAETPRRLRVQAPGRGSFLLLPLSSCVVSKACTTYSFGNLVSIQHDRRVQCSPITIPQGTKPAGVMPQHVRTHTHVHEHTFTQKLTNTCMQAHNMHAHQYTLMFR